MWTCPTRTGWNVTSSDWPPPHVQDHIATMARLHKDNRYDRFITDVSDLLGHPPSGFDALIQDTPALQRTS